MPHPNCSFQRFRAAAFALLALALTSCALAFLHAAPAQAATPSSTQAITGIEKVSDPDTSGGWRDALASGGDSDTYSTDQAGRVWVDKSVWATDNDLAQAGMDDLTLNDPENDFMVGISAIASAASIRQESDTAHDVVFVVSLNRMLADMSYADQAHAAYLVSALNEAIGRVLAQGGGAGEARAAVVGYAANAAVLMPLASYDPASDGTYLAYDPDAATIRVTATVRNGSADGSTTQDGRLGGGSYLQRALYLAGEQLVQGAAMGTDSRAPSLVVMGIETPPMANTAIAAPPAYTGDATNFMGPLPNSHDTGYGTDAMFATMLTMRSVEQRIDAAYSAEHPLTIYTTGIDTTDAVAYLLETAEQQAAHQLTANVGGSTVDLSQNISDAAEGYAAAAANGEHSVELALYGSGKRGLESKNVTLPVVDGLLDSQDPTAISCVDRYYPARSASAINWAFAAATDAMLGISYISPVNAQATLAGGTRIEASDVIGAGMSVESVRGIRYGTTMLDGSLAAAAVTMSLDDPSDLSGATHEFDYLVRSINTRYNLDYAAYDLFYQAKLEGQMAYENSSSYSNRVAYYVDSGHQMVPDGSTPYSFASQAELDAAVAGTASGEVAENIQAARDRGATAICDTYFYIGNLPNPYTGGDVALYDFYVMVETDLATAQQTVLLSIPADAVPALRASVTIARDGSASMALDATENLAPVRLMYEVAPRPEVRAVLDRIRAGEKLDFNALEQELGSALVAGADGSPIVPAGAVEESDGALNARAAASGRAATTGNAYTLAADAPLFEFAPGTSRGDGELPARNQLVPLTGEPVTGTTYYYVQDAYEARFSSIDEPAVAKQVQIVKAYTIPTDGSASWHVGERGQYELNAGTPLAPSASSNVVAKQENATQTAPYARTFSVSSSDNGAALAARLGNNGAFVFTRASEEPDHGEDGGTNQPDQGGDGSGDNTSSGTGGATNPTPPTSQPGGNESSAADNENSAPHANTSNTPAQRPGAGTLAATSDIEIDALAATVGSIGLALLGGGIALALRTWRRSH